MKLIHVKAPNSKGKTLALVLTTVIFMLSHPSFTVHAQDTPAKTEGTVRGKPATSQKTKDEQAAIEASYSKITKLMAKGDIEAATKLMTPAAVDDYMGELFLMATQIVDSEMADQMPFTKQLSQTLKKYGLDRIEIPVMPMGPGDEQPDQKEMEKAKAKLVAAANKGGKKFEAFQSVRKLTDQFVMGMDPFQGSIVNQTVTGNTAIVEVAMEVPEMAEGEMGTIVDAEQMEDLQGESGEPIDMEQLPMLSFEMPHLFLTFQKKGTEWLWSGIDIEKTQEAMSSFDMGGRPEPLPLIKDFKLKGKDLDGKEIALEKFAGKFVLVDFWGTWCGPCVAELPALKKIHAAFAKHGFEIIGVAADDKESLADFLKKRKLPWPNIVDSNGKLSDKYGIQAYPTTLLVNKEGKHISSDLFGAELIDELIKQMKLDPKEFETLKKELHKKESSHASDAENPIPQPGGNAPEVGFSAADTDADKSVNAKELKRYLSERLQGVDLPHKKIFAQIDKNKDGSISESEFAERHKAIEKFMGDDFFGGSMPSDPGPTFVPFTGLDRPVDDRAIFGALFHRYQQAEPNLADVQVELDAIPVAAPSLKNKLDISDGARTNGKGSVESLVKSSLIIAGGGQEFFTAGAVLISDDGLAITNYHVAQAMSDTNLVAMTHDGKVHHVSEFVVGNKDRDVAIVRLKIANGTYPFSVVAQSTPRVGDDMVMLHHSENRFYTYDRGYVMRHPKLGDHTWMEISADYAPGGSGCGIYNKNHELIGLVSMIQFGDGPSLAEGDFSEDDWGQDQDQGGNFDEGPAGMDGQGGMLLVKHAVSLPAIRSLWAKTLATDVSSTSNKTEKETQGTPTTIEAVVPDNPLFEPPQQLTVHGKPINENDTMYMPSPAIFDVDNDQQNELVIGDLMGNLTVFENQNQAQGQPVWKAGRPLKSNKQLIKLENW